MPLALGPVALGLRAYILGKSLVPMLQLLLICNCNCLLDYCKTSLNNKTHHAILSPNNAVVCLATVKPAKNIKP